MTGNRPKRIVHVPRRFVAEEWGGTETVILEISRQQQRAGWEPEIFTSMALAKQRQESFGGVPVKRYSYCYPFFGLSPGEKALYEAALKEGMAVSFDTGPTWANWAAEFRAFESRYPGIQLVYNDISP